VAATGTFLSHICPVPDAMACFNGAGHSGLERNGRYPMKNRVSALIAFMLLMAAPVLAQQVSVDYLKSVDFSQFHTYAWGEENPNQIRNSILAQVAKTQIESAMQSKGFTQVKRTENPDLLLVASGGARQQTSYSAFGTGPRFGGGMATITPQQSTAGTLIVSLYKPAEKQLVWRGIARGTLSNNGDKNQKLVEKAVDKMFKKYPTK
jgi:hypothetical protein